MRGNLLYSFLCMPSLLLLRLSLSRSFFVATSATGNVSSFVIPVTGATVGQKSTTARHLSSNNNNNNMVVPIDPDYPGTAVERLRNVHARIQQVPAQDWNATWDEVRRKLLWAGGLKDLPDAIPGQGYTGHSFNDYNHVDLTCMLGDVADNENDGAVQGIAIGNRLGAGIRIASLPELGPGGSWSTCAMGCNKDPPQDVAHVQFRSRIAFKLVWVPTKEFDSFVLVDDDGKLLAKGKPSGPADLLPPLRERVVNYRLVEGSKYSTVADALAKEAFVE